ncbi:MAG: 30S ribosomal protein S20 [Alphaproteobacteria bacterium]|nr:30S ribosomal protein S20 [Alphaproteobacteria bacterium]MCD8519802.1 30S ribosomal protein S20 [Alphaproteobacteria bacterium]MCD8571432.1 30S ribosomal protein S20 [Alphaproteobacteria bacterium]
MANHESAIKRVKRNTRRADVNTARRSRIRTFLKKVELAIASGDRKNAETALKEAQPELFRGVAKGILPKNTAARKMSRLNARVKALA